MSLFDRLMLISITILMGLFAYSMHKSSEKLTDLSIEAVQMRHVESRLDGHDDRFRNITSRIQVLERKDLAPLP